MPRHRKPSSRAALAVFAVAVGILAICTLSGCSDGSEVRAELALEHLVATTSGDVDTILSTSTGILAQQFEEAREEFGPLTEVKVTDQEWDGTALRATLTVSVDGVDQLTEYTITPDDRTDNVEVRAEGDSVDAGEPDYVVLVLVEDDGWKVADYLIGGETSWVEAVEQSNAEQRPEDSWMNEEDTSDASVCKRNQYSIESAFMTEWGGPDLAPELASYKGGPVTDLESGPAALVPEPFSEMPHCPTEETDYTYTLENMPEKGVIFSVSCSNPEHAR